MRETETMGQPSTPGAYLAQHVADENRQRFDAGLSDWMIGMPAHREAEVRATLERTLWAAALELDTARRSLGWALLCALLPAHGRRAAVRRGWYAGAAHYNKGD